MIYKKITIRNFKGIEEVIIDFSHNRIITLVGLNESGKTTVLEAITLYYKMLKGLKIDAQTLNTIRPKGIDFTGTIQISASLEFEEEDYAKFGSFLKEENRTERIVFPKVFDYTFNFDYETHTYSSTRRTVTFDAKENTKSTPLHKSKNDLWQNLVNYVKAELIPEILYYEDFIFEIPDKIEFNIDGKVDEGQESVVADEWKLVLDDILNTLSDKFTSFKQNVVDIWRTDNDTARQRLSIMEKKLDKVITSAWKELFGQENKKDGRLNFKEIKLIPNQEDLDRISFSFKVKTESGAEFSINERSKGCKWFFSFLIFTEFRKNRTKNILFLLDEPASNLHSSAQLKILNAIESLSDKSVVVYSTHSYHLINPKWLNGAYVVINEGISESNLQGALTDTDSMITVEKYYNYVSKRSQNFQPLYFQPILDRLDYKASFIEPIPNITISEGKYDWFTFRYMSEIIIKDNRKFNFYPGKGRDDHWDIINLYLSWGTPFLLILDGDNPGRTSKEQYLKELPGILADKIFTLHDVLNKEVCTEEMFLPSDQELICDTAFGVDTYKNIKSSSSKLKSKLNYAINQLYVAGTEVKLSEECVQSFIKLFDFIQNRKLALQD